MTKFIMEVTRMSTTGIRRNQGRWHTLKLSCIARIAKTDGALGNTILACLLILLADIICMFVTESYLACVAVNTLMIVVWATARRAHYQVVLPEALASASLALVLHLWHDVFYMGFVILITNFMIALRPELFRRWRYHKALLAILSLISCVIIIVLLPILPKDMLFNNRHKFIYDLIAFIIIGYIWRVVGKQISDKVYGHDDVEAKGIDNSDVPINS